MSLNPVPVGDAIAAFVQANKPADGTPVTTSQLQYIWEGIVTIIYNDLKANLSVTPGSFTVHGVKSGPDTVTVSGVSGPAT